MGDLILPYGTPRFPPSVLFFQWATSGNLKSLLTVVARTQIERARWCFVKKPSSVNYTERSPEISLKTDRFEAAHKSLIKPFDSRLSLGKNE